LFGTYHHVSEQHLHRYLAEFDFRYNNRVAKGVNDETRAARMVEGVAKSVPPVERQLTKEEGASHGPKLPWWKSKRKTISSA
jgi:hypothetical protein